MSFVPYFRGWAIDDIRKIVTAVGIELVDDHFVSSQHKHRWRCKKHNHIFERTFTQIHHGGLHCDKCRDEIGRWDPKTKTPRELDFKNPNSYWSKNKKKIRDKIKELGAVPKRGRKKFTVPDVKLIVTPILENLNIDQQIIIKDGKTNLRTRPIVIGTDLRSKSEYMSKCMHILKILKPKSTEHA